VVPVEGKLECIYQSLIPWKLSVQLENGIYPPLLIRRSAGASSLEIDRATNEHRLREISLRLANEYCSKGFQRS
jgi:hypothetical protein